MALCFPSTRSRNGLGRSIKRQAQLLEIQNQSDMKRHGPQAKRLLPCLNELLRDWSVMGRRIVPRLLP